MKKLKYILIVTILIMGILPNIVYASDSANPSSEMIPKLEDLYNSDNKYFTEYKDNYYLDLEDIFIKGKIGELLNGGANLMFELEVLLTQVISAIIYYTFEISIFDLFSGPIDTIVKNLKVGIFDEFALLCISFIGIYYIFKMLRNQKTQVLMTLVKMICIIVLALMFFREPTAMIRGIDTLSKGIGQAALEGTYKATMNGESSNSATEAITTNLWIMFVHKPWQILEFGSTSFATKYEDEILRLSPGSDERQELINDIAEDDIHFKANLGLKRLGITVLYFLIFLLLAAVIIAFCFLIIGYQFLLLIFALMGPIVLLIALIPGYGFNTLKAWGGKLISYGSMKAILSFIMAILFSFLISTYEFTDTYGILIVSIIQVALLVIVWWKKEVLFEGFFKFASSAKEMPTPQSVNRMLRQDVSIENGIRNWNRRRQELKGYNSSDDYYNFNDDGYGENEDCEYQQDEVKNKGKQNNQRRNRTRGNVDYYEFESSNENGISSINSNLNELRRVAEEILEERYRNSKNESEEKARLLDKDPEYSSWVKTVMNREEMNLPKFDEREKQAVINQIKQAEEMGVDINDMEMLEETSENKQYIKRPSSISTERPQEVKVDKEQELKPRLSNREASKKYLDTFNQTFQKNYNEKFMYSLVDSYGQESVGNVIDDMVRINDESGINNATGYLLKSLNNNKENENSTEKIQHKQKNEKTQEKRDSKSNPQNLDLKVKEDLEE